MSYSELVLFGGDSKVSTRVEFRNGYGYAMPIWNWLAARYLPGNKDWFYEKQGQPVFDLKSDPRLEEWERICLLASFDRVVIYRRDFEKLAEAFATAELEFKKQHPDYVCHYGEMAKRLREAVDSTAAAFNATSVSEDQWQTREECECPKCGNSHTAEDARPYDLTRDEEHWNLFEHPSLALQSPAKRSRSK